MIHIVICVTIVFIVFIIGKTITNVKKIEAEKDYELKKYKYLKEQNDFKITDLEKELNWNLVFKKKLEEKYTNLLKDHERLLNAYNYNPNKKK